MTDNLEDSNLYFKGIILPKSLSTNPLIDLENGFVLTDERKEKKKEFSTQEIYSAIKEQNPVLLDSLLNLSIENHKKEDFKVLLEKDGLIKPDKIEIPKFENKILNNVFNSLKSTLKVVFYKDSKLFISNSKIDFKDENNCLGWVRTNLFEVYIFTDTKTSTLIDYYISGHANTLKKTIDQSVLNAYKKFLIIFKEVYLKTIESKIDTGVSSLTKPIVEKHFVKNPKYYILELELDDKKIEFYITLKKAKNA